MSDLAGKLSDFDNFDEFINDLSGAGSVHLTRGIMMQEICRNSDGNIGDGQPEIAERHASTAC